MIILFIYLILYILTRMAFRFICLNIGLYKNYWWLCLAFINVFSRLHLVLMKT